MRERRAEWSLAVWSLGLFLGLSLTYPAFASNLKIRSNIECAGLEDNLKFYISTKEEASDIRSVSSYLYNTEAGERRELQIRATKKILPPIVINEIMYDFPGGDGGHEWVEIYNIGTESVDLTGWRFNDGSTHTLSPYQGSLTIPAGGYAILADDPATFLSDYPGYTGIVLNTSINLPSTLGTVTILDNSQPRQVVDFVVYTKTLGGAGNGKSLERINPADTSSVSNWGESLVNKGSPGRVNTLSCGTITGRVKDTSGRPISGALIEAFDSYATATTNENGSYTISGLSAGTYTLKVTCGGYDSETKTVSVTPGQITFQDFTLTKVGKIIGLYPTQGYVGDAVTVKGDGFWASELIRIQFGTTYTITTTYTDTSGQFAVVFTINSQENIGTTTIVAYGVLSHTYAKAYFVILPPTILRITPGIKKVTTGSIFTYQVEIEDVKRLRVAELHLSFNPNILQVIEIATGTFPPEGWVMQNKFDNTTGEIDYTIGVISGSATGSGVLCNIKFRAISGGTSSVNFDFDDEHNRMTRLRRVENLDIPFNKEFALCYVITSISVLPKDKVVKADEVVNYTCIVSVNNSEFDVTGSTTFTALGGGSFTLNTFFAYYMGTYTVQVDYLGFIGTTSVIILPGRATSLVYVSGNNQVNTCTFTLKEPFIVKVVDKYGNPCKDVEVNWEIIKFPLQAVESSISPINTTTNIQGIASSSFTLGTEPPGIYIVHAISTGLLGSPCIFTAHSLRRFGNIAGFCMLDLGRVTLGTCSDIEVRIIELRTTTITNDKSYFIFEKIPVGTYTLTFDTWGASPLTMTDVCINPTQFEDTTDIGTISLLVGDVNNDGKVNIIDWTVFVDAFGDYESSPKPESNWGKNKEGDFKRDKAVNSLDFEIFADNFGKQQGKSKAKGLSGMPTTPTKKTLGEIKLSFDLKTPNGGDINELRVGNIIYLKISVHDAKDFLGGEVHLSFNPKVLQVVNVPIPPDIMPTYQRMTIERIPTVSGDVRIQQGNYPIGTPTYVLINKVNNTEGKIDYAVGVLKPETEDEGVLAIVPFKVISCGAYSKVGFEFDDEENRKTMFIERIGGNDHLPEVLSPAEVTITVPKVFNNLDSVVVYPNPAYKGQEVTFGNLTTPKQVILRIYNVAGELVAEKEKAKGNRESIKWNLRNKDNEYVASGIYIYSLKDGNGSIKTGKIGVIK